ncbi:hypothetical protein Taro_026361 [Colocasia esculenta]|uniref:Uncharacterized protein n=1 Tax=Colocasia esculenta TaxID=4460 RepID=A0A843VR40_COLES|nr:hypothetical protein [Colocasia esculenta]
MDAVELPLPTTVVTKLLASEGFGRVRESESRDSGAVSAVGGGGGASPFSSQKPSSSCGSFHRDVKYPVSVIEHDPVSRNKKSGDGLHDNVSTSLKHKDSGKKVCSVEDDLSTRSWPKYDSKQLHKKHVKRRNSPKQGRSGHAVVSMNAHTIKGCTADKSRIVKHKQRQECKRSDRKAMRTTVKAKFDSFMSKDSLVHSHLAVTGKNVYGTFGVRFDLLDDTKNVDELSLAELLDGSFKCPNICHDKVKKASNANENILLSVRKAASILATPNTGGSSGSRKAPGIPTSADCDDEEKIIEESAVSDQIQNQAPISDSVLYQPRDILERLALPAAHDLNSVLVDSFSSVAPFKSTASVSKASLPHFPWSVSHSGSCKPIVDNSKSATTRSTSQGRWVRIGSTSCLVGEERSCFSELDLKMDVCTGASRPQHVVDHSLNLETLKLHDNVSYNVQNCMPYDANAISKPINISDVTTSKSSSGVLNCYDPFNTMAVKVETSNVYQLGFKESTVVVDMETQGILQPGKNESTVVNRSVSNLQIQEKLSYTEEENTVKSMWGHNGKNCYYTSSSTLEGTNQCLSHSTVREDSTSDYSPRLLAAAAILCDIASTRKRNHNAGRAILPNIPLQTAMKARKSRPFISKTDGPKPQAKTGEPTKRTNRTASPECIKPIVGDDKSKTICMSSVGRGPVRWSSPENTYSSKSGREFAIKPMQNSPVGLMGQPPLLSRPEKGYDGRRKHRSPAVMATSVSTAPTYVKDWGKGRHRRE